MIKVLELFAGIGACSKALENLGIDHQIVDAVEIDKYAIKSFNAIHNTNFEPQDITKWDKDIEVDLIMHGSPCQDFSIAGRQAGGDKSIGTRSSLMYETLRIVEKLKPKYVIWENVKNLISKKHIHNFNDYLQFMEKLGYKNYYKVLNAKDYGIPQKRERIFTVSILGNRDFIFPDKQVLDKRLKDFLEDIVDDSYDVSENQLKGMIITNYNSYKLTKLLKEPNDIVDTIKARFIGCPQLVIRTNNKKGYDIVNNYDGIDVSYPNSTTRRGRVGKGCIGTITIANIQCVLNNKIRKLTPRECWRLMGFDDIDFDKASKVNSNAQLYKQAGNSIVVNVIQAILKNLLFNDGWMLLDKYIEYSKSR